MRSEQRAAAASSEPRAADPEPRAYSVVWWDPTSLALDADSGYGLRRDDLISKDGDPAKVAARLAAYQKWRAERDAQPPRPACRRCACARRRRSPAIAALDRSRLSMGHRRTTEIEVIDFSRTTERPFGPRFGILVHATLATVPLDANETRHRCRCGGAGPYHPDGGREPYADEEVYAAVEVVTALLKDPLFDRVRAGRARRPLRPRAARSSGRRRTGRSSRARSTWRSRISRA